MGAWKPKIVGWLGLAAYGWVALLVVPCLPGCGWLLTFPPPSSAELRFNVAGPGGAVAVTGEPIFSEQAIFTDIPGKVGSHAAAVTAFADGELLGAWYSYSGPHELDGSAIYMARRPAERQEWDSPWLHIDRPEGDGNPVLYSEGDRVWLFSAVVPGGWSTARIEMQQSFDRGRTWSAPSLVSGLLGANVRFPPLRVAEGSLLLPAYDDFLRRSLFFFSTDGLSWSLGAAVYTAAPHTNIQPSVARLGDGRLLAVMRNSGRGWLWVMASRDQGGSWSEPIDSGFPNPDSGAALLNLASGNLILVFNDSTTQRRPLSVALSGDLGVTWPYRRVLADGQTTYSYPALVQTGDGLVHVLYSLGRETIRHVTINESWIVVGQEGG